MRRGLPRIFDAGPEPGRRAGYVNFLFGDHGSIIDPRASLATTVEMQAESQRVRQHPRHA